MLPGTGASIRAPVGTRTAKRRPARAKSAAPTGPRPFQPSRRLRELGAYAFAEADRQVAELRARGVKVLDFGVGDPTDPTPELVREACKRAVDVHARSGYPSTIGSPGFRRAAAAWIERRFGVRLDPETEIAATIGSKEGIFHFGEVVLDPGDVALCPSPGYPPYSRGTRFAEGTPHFLPLRAERGFLPDLAAVPRPVLRRAKVLWVNYPNNPTGAVAPPSFLGEAAAFARRHGIVLASDEAYSEMYFGAEPGSALEHGTEGVVAFFSLSKRSAMTGYRVGFVAGDRAIVSAFKKLKTNVDSGTPSFIQDAAIAALSDETHVAAMREGYRRRRDILCDALAAVGAPRCVPDGTLYVWQRVPRGWTGESFAERLRREDLAIVGTPGAWISETLRDGTNPGADHLRFALVPGEDDCREAARRLAAWGGKR